mgnify:CR=1 FL=1
METKQELYAELDDETLAVLERNAFDAEQFLQLRRDFLRGRYSRESNRIDGQIEAPSPDDLDVLPSRESVDGRRLRQLGREAIHNGEVGLCVLNGGMATRFGGAVKGCVEVFDGRSFLELKLRDAARWDGNVDVLVMNSFNTDEPTREHLVDGEFFECSPEDVFLFKQNVAIRLTPDGELFRDEEGQVSLYPPGHGDLPEALNRGVLERFVEGGGRYLLMSNVDNLLATLDPLVIGSHVKASRSGAEMTVEAVKSEPDDSGGKPARVDGKLRLVESFQFPESFPFSAIPVHNTNTLTFDAEALRRDFDLNWYVVEKEADGRTTIQFERLAGELTAELDTHILSVPREGEWSRYLPIKTREDLASNRGYLKRRLQNRDII